MRLGSEVLEEQGVHRAIETDMQLGNLTLRQGDQRDVCKGQGLPDAGGVLLVAADPVQRLGQHDVEEATLGIGDQGLQARAVGGGAAQRVVGIDLGDRPALSLGARPADTHLIVDRVLRLALRRVARVDRNTPVWRVVLGRSIGHR